MDDVHHHEDLKGVYLDDDLMVVTPTSSSGTSMTISFYASDKTVTASGSGIFAVNLGKRTLAEVDGKIVGIAGSGGSAPCRLSRYDVYYEFNQVSLSVSETTDKNHIRLGETSEYNYRYTVNVEAECEGNATTGTVTMVDQLPDGVTYNGNAVVTKISTDGTRTVLSEVDDTSLLTNKNNYMLEYDTNTNTVIFRYLGGDGIKIQDAGLADGEKFEITYTVTVDPTIKEGGALTDLKKIYADGIEKETSVDVNLVEYVVIFRDKKGADITTIPLLTIQP